MSENQNPETDTTDEVEGHAFSSGRIEADDVEGHGASANRGACAGRGASPGRGASSSRFRPDEEEMFGQDVTGHGFTGRGLVEDEPGDVEGHGIRVSRLADESDDVEGHRAYAGSDVNIKHDVVPVESDQDDTEGHRTYAMSDGNLKHDVVPVEDDDGDDAEGHGIRAGV